MRITFTEYRQQRKSAFELLRPYKEADEINKSDLGAYAKKQVAQDASAVGSKARVVIKGAGEIATDVATGNVVGAAFSIWKWIKGVADLHGGMKSFANAGSLVHKIEKHKAGLAQYLQSQNIQPPAIKKIVDAIFEIDADSVEDVNPRIWGAATTEFIRRLDTGYDGINNKIFAVVVHEQLMELLKKMAGHSDELTNSVNELMKERQEKIAVLASPQVKQVVASFHPDEEGRQQEQPEQTGKLQPPKNFAEFSRLPVKNKYNPGDIIYKHGGSNKILTGVVFNDREAGLHTFYDGDKQVYGDNHENVKSAGETINDIKNTPFYKNLVNFLKTGRVGREDAKQWAKQVGIDLGEESSDSLEIMKEMLPLVKDAARGTISQDKPDDNLRRLNGLARKLHGILHKDYTNKDYELEDAMEGLSVSMHNETAKQYQEKAKAAYLAIRAAIFRLTGEV